LHVYNFITREFRHQPEVTQLHKSANILHVGKDKADRKYNRLKLGGGQAYFLSKELSTITAENKFETP
jgi:hypothetical protein